MKNLSYITKRLAPFLGAGCFLIGCSSVTTSRDGAGFFSPDALPVTLVMVSSPQCRSLPAGCGLGGQVGGIDAQRRLYTALRLQNETIAFWAGSIFSCDGGRNFPAAADFAEISKGLPLQFLAPSAEDLKLPAKQLDSWRVLSEKPWIVSNFEEKKRPAGWLPFLDLAAGAGKFRVFNFTWGFKDKRKTGQNLFSDIKRIEKMLAETPAGRVNVVVVSTVNARFLAAIQKTRGAHVIFDAMSLDEEINGPRLLNTEQLTTTSRGQGRAAFVLHLKTEKQFKGFYNEDVGRLMRTRRDYGLLPTATDPAANKVPGLWDTRGEIALLVDAE